MLSRNSNACSERIRCLPGMRVKVEYTSTRLCAAQQPLVLVALNESSDTGGVVDVIAIENRNKRRRIEETYHPFLPRFAKSRSLRSSSNTLSVADLAKGSPA